MKLLRKRKIILPKGFFLPNCGAFIVEIQLDSQYEKSARGWKKRDPQDEIVKLLVLTADGKISKFRTIMEVDNSLFNLIFKSLIPKYIKVKYLIFLSSTFLSLYLFFNNLTLH